MLFRDPPAHTRLRNLCAAAFSPARVTALRGHIQNIADGLIDKFIQAGRADIVHGLAAPMPAIFTAEMLGVPVSDHEKLKQWSIDFAEILGNFSTSAGPDCAGGGQCARYDGVLPSSDPRTGDKSSRRADPFFGIRECRWYAGSMRKKS